MQNYQQPYGMPKPGVLTAVAVLTLIDGILNLLAGLAWMITIIGAPIGIYSIVLGIMELVYAPKILADPIRVRQPATHIAIMQIINIISFSVISLVIGILALVFYNDPRVKSYFHYVNGGRSPYEPVPHAPPIQR